MPMTTADLLYIALIAVAAALDHFVLWGTFLRRSRQEPAAARVRLWSSWMVMLWVLAGVGLAVWARDHRTWTSLRVALPHGTRLVGSIGLLLVLTVMQGLSLRRIADSHSQRARARQRIGALAPMLPRSGSELRMFIALSVTAGCCEEAIFRGYLPCILRPVLGLWGAVAVSTAAFAAAHAYQGRNGVLSAGILGLLFSLIVLGFGSLWPAIVLHALIDVGGGITAWLALRETRAGDGTVASCGASG
jgi:membrane protease YdiL (CAAX protease family)